MLIPYTARWYLEVAPRRIYRRLTASSTKAEKYVKRLDRKKSVDLRKRVYAELLKIVLAHPERSKHHERQQVSVSWHEHLAFAFRKVLMVMGEADLLAMFGSDGDLRLHFDTGIVEMQEFLIAKLKLTPIVPDQRLQPPLLCLLNTFAAIADRRRVLQEALRLSAESIPRHDSGGGHLGDSRLNWYCQLYAELNKNEPQEQQLAFTVRPLLSAYDWKTRERGYALANGTIPSSLQPELFRDAFEHSNAPSVQTELLKRLCGLRNGRDSALPLVKELIRRPLKCLGPGYSGSLHKSYDPVREAADAALKELVLDSEALAVYSNIVLTQEPIDVFEAIRVLTTSYDPIMIATEFRKAFNSTDHALADTLLRCQVRIKDHLDDGASVLVAALSFLPHDAVIRVFEEVGFRPHWRLAEMLQASIETGRITVTETLLSYLKAHVPLESREGLNEELEAVLFAWCQFLARYTSLEKQVDLLAKGLASSIGRSETRYFIASLQQVLDPRAVEEMLCRKFDAVEPDQLRAYAIHSHLLAIVDTEIVLKDNDLVERIRRVRSESYEFLDGPRVSNTEAADKILLRSRGIIR